MITCYSCDDGPVNANNAPTLEFLSMNKDTMSQSTSTTDSIVVSLRFEDIDGDIAGIEPQMRPFNISIIDSRDGNVDPVSFPAFPDLSKGQRGELNLTILTTCCLNPTSNPCERDTITPSNIYTYDIVIEDANGNSSNAVTTPPITLLCN